MLGAQVVSPANALVRSSLIKLRSFFVLSSDRMTLRLTNNTNAQQLGQRVCGTTEADSSSCLIVRRSQLEMGSTVHC